MHELLERSRIVALAVLAAITYGVLHDQVTVRVCLEYFTIAHPPVFETRDPTRLALGWGVIATWWVGLLLGVPLALVARAGPRPPLAASALPRPVGVLLLAMAGGAAAAGVVGYLLARSGAVVVLEPLASELDAARHPRFVGVLWAHLASYTLGFLGGAVCLAQVWRLRGRAAPQAEVVAEAPARAAPARGLARTALVLAARLAFVPQLVLLVHATILGIATIAGGVDAYRSARMTSGVFALLVLGIGAAAWPAQGLPGRAATVLLGLPALWLLVVAIEYLL